MRATTRLRDMRTAFQIIAALLAIAENAPAEVLQQICPARGTVGEDERIEFTIAIDLSSSAISEGDFRWTATYGAQTIDWDLNRRSGELRGVILTARDAGLLIVGECARGDEERVA